MKVSDAPSPHKTRAVTTAATLIVLLSALAAAGFHWSQPSANPTKSRQVPESTAARQLKQVEIPMSFEPNLGQVQGDATFLSRGRGYRLFLKPDEAVFLLEKSAANQETRNLKLDAGQPKAPTDRTQQDNDQAALAMRLVGANRGASGTGLGQYPATSNYYIGNDPALWHTNIPNYGKVQYQNVYPGIDLVYYGNQNQLEYDFVVEPGADPGRIALSFEKQGEQPHGPDQPSLKDARLDPNGDLLIRVGGQDVRFLKPLVYQAASGTGVKTPIEAKYVLRADNHIGFELGRYDRSQSLVVDPVLLYSSYLGGNAYDQGFGIQIDPSGNIIVAGTTASTNFPTSTPSQQGTNAGGQDVFVSKFNSSGTSLIYSTYIGGIKDDDCESVALDPSGNAYVIGFTSSTDFPTLNAIQALKGAQNVFLFKLDVNGNLVFSTFYGGSGEDQAYGIALDSSGIYVVGNTTSSDYPTVNPYQPQIANGDDAFLTKFALDGSSAIYSTYLGGTGGGSQAYSVAVDSSQSAYVTGFTNSTSFPVLNAYQSQNLASPTTPGSVFVTKFAPTGNTLVYSTYLGGTNTQSAGSIAVDSSGSAYIVGGTASNDFPTLNAYQSKFGGNFDMFVTKFNSSGNALVYSTYLGGSSNDFADAITVDSLGNAHVAGYSLSPNFPVTPDAFQPTSGGNWDAVVFELNPAGNALMYSSYLGGSGIDVADAIALDSAGNVYLTGTEASSNFPTTANAMQTSNGGSNDAYLAIVGIPDFSITPASPTLTLQPGAQGTDVITLAGLNGTFPSAVQLTCAVTGTAPVPTCSLSPTSVTPGSSSATSTLTVTAPAAAQLRSVDRKFGRWVYAMWLPLMFGVAFVGRSNRRRRSPWILCCILALGSLWLTACSSGSGSKGPTQNVTNFTLTVTGTAGARQHTAQVTVTVQ